MDLTREQFKADQQFQECSLPEPLIMSVAGEQAELLLHKVSLLLRPALEADNLAAPNLSLQPARVGVR